MHRHGTHLSAIDLMMQELLHLATLAAAEDRAAIEQMSLCELRKRLTRKSIR
jgi:hypothetical protein